MPSYATICRSHPVSQWSPRLFPLDLDLGIALDLDQDLLYSPQQRALTVHVSC